MRRANTQSRKARAQRFGRALTPFDGFAKARFGRLSASALTQTGRCLLLRRISFGRRPRPVLMFFCRATAGRRVPTPWSSTKCRPA